MLLICLVLSPFTYYLNLSNFILESGFSYNFRVLTICLLLVYFVNAAGDLFKICGHQRQGKFYMILHGPILLKLNEQLNAIFTVLHITLKIFHLCRVTSEFFGPLLKKIVA